MSISKTSSIPEAGTMTKTHHQRRIQALKPLVWGLDLAFVRFFWGACLRPLGVQTRVSAGNPSFSVATSRRIPATRPGETRSALAADAAGQTARATNASARRVDCHSGQTATTEHQDPG